MEVEFFDIDRRNAWHIIFQEIRNESNNFDHIIRDAKKTENKNLNRYRDVNPFDHSRVRLRRNGIDYINASLVNVESADRSYILTQGPLPLTTGHFWLMVWEQASRGILMLNRLIEKNAIKCHQYWPVGRKNGGDDTLILSDVNLKITIEDEIELSHYSIRRFCLRDLESSQSREVVQFHYTTWPDFGVPESPAAFLNFLFAVRESGVLDSKFGPPIVHCSAGIGRSGTFCLVDSCLVLIEKNSDLNCINIRKQLLEMRHYRMGLIQTPDQLRFSYLAIIEGAKIVLSSESSADNSNLAQVCNNVPTLPQNLITFEDEVFGSDVNPPPLPPRSSRSSDDLSSDISISDNVREKSDELKDNELDLICQKILERNANSYAENPYDSYESELEAQELISILSDERELDAPLVRNNDSLSELRKRARKEREEKTASLVQNIKKKQKETELWQKRKKSFLKISFSLALIIGLGYFAYKLYSKS